jgi:N6-L-threonylcarbamoyladenine synthase
LDYPGGPRLAQLADEYQGEEPLYTLPQVMLNNAGFSFSGLKTAIRNLIVKADAAGERDIRRLAASIQSSIIDALLLKTKRALKETGVSTLVVTGGVAANKRLRAEIRALPGVTSFFPSPLHSMDNASMIAVPASYRFRYGAGALAAESVSSESVYSRWPVETLSALL